MQGLESHSSISVQGAERKYSTNNRAGSQSHFKRSCLHEIELVYTCFTDGTGVAISTDTEVSSCSVVAGSKVQTGVKGAGSHGWKQSVQVMGAWGCSLS